MARARNIKPGFFRNADLVELPFEARLLFIGLWTMADRDGRMEDRPKQIKMELFPADSVDCDALLNQLTEIKMVARYEHGGKRYLQVVNFAKHQNPHRDEKASTVPDQHGNVAEPKATSSKHSASTVQAPCKEDAGTVAIGLNPDPRILIPDSLIPESKGEETVVFEQPERIEQPPPLKTGAICIVLKSEGIAAVNPSHPDLTALINAGAEVGHFAEAARASVAKGKPSFSYVLAVVKGQMRDAALLAKEALERPAAKPANQIETFAERDARNARSRWEEMTGQTHPDNIKKQPGYVIDCDRQPLEISHVNAH